MTDDTSAAVGPVAEIMSFNSEWPTPRAGRPGELTLGAMPNRYVGAS
ncbi:MAG TPA: hypothetical protein VGP10_02140 [Marisediminicola sp.]|jgi:hypothetical protein|nr:hypothetical protein [Cryobacterium sp.]HEV7955938.1 hypothetical protein [Marisediminicola sp.]